MYAETYEDPHSNALKTTQRSGEGEDLPRSSFNGKLYYILSLSLSKIQYNEQEDSSHVTTLGYCLYTKA